MGFEEGLFTYLDADAGITALIGSRIYPIRLPQNPTLPALTYQRISTPRLHEFERSFLPHPRFQFDCWGGDYGEAKDLADAVRTALDVYRGTMGTETVQMVTVDNEMDGIDAASGIYHVILETVIWYEG